MTKKELESYRFLQKLIEKDEKKLQHYKDNPPVAMHGKVQSSNKVFPYQPISVTVSGPDITDRKAWEKKKSEVIVKLHEERVRLEQLRIVIDEFFLGIEDARDRLVFEYLYRDGMTQEEVGKELFLDRSSVSKIVDRYVK